RAVAADVDRRWGCVARVVLPADHAPGVVGVRGADAGVEEGDVDVRGAAETRRAGEARRPDGADASAPRGLGEVELDGAIGIEQEQALAEARRGAGERAPRDRPGEAVADAPEDVADAPAARGEGGEVARLDRR